MLIRLSHLGLTTRSCTRRLYQIKKGGHKGVIFNKWSCGGPCHRLRLNRGCHWCSEVIPLAKPRSFPYLPVVASKINGNCDSRAAREMRSLSHFDAKAHFWRGVKCGYPVSFLVVLPCGPLPELLAQSKFDFTNSPINPLDETVSQLR